MHSQPTLRYVPACFAGVLVCTTANLAAAACAASAPSVVWSYPADGDAGVPTDAVVQLISTAAIRTTHSATLNGAPVVASDEGVYPLEGLVPDTDYTFRLEPIQSAGQSIPVTEIRFRTGGSVAAEAEAPRVNAASAASRVVPAMSALCLAAYEAGECFDTPLYIHQRLELEASDAVAWQIDRGDGIEGYGKVWPAECAPTLTIFETLLREDPPCYELRAISANGALSEPERYCAGETGQQTEVGADDAGSCSAVQVRAGHRLRLLPALTGIGLLGLGLGALHRRRRGQRARGAVGPRMDGRSS